MAMPVLERVEGRVQLGFLAAQADLPASGVVDAGDDLHQRRLAGAVLAHERMDGAGLEAELDVVQRHHAREFLADTLDRQQISPLGRRRSSRTAAVVGAGHRTVPPCGRLRRGRRARLGNRRPATVAAVSSWSRIVHVGGRDELERDLDVALDRLALGELQRRVDRALALAGGVLEHGDVELARLHRRQRILGRVDAGDDDLAMSQPAAFIAWIAPIAISSLLETRASN